MSSDRLPTIDFLRGIAALAVVWYHCTVGSGLITSGWLYRSGQYGWVGVDIFFAISGFIIPHTLHRRGYRISHFGRFLLKRMARLDPPYFACILLCVSLSYLVTLAPGFRGEHPHYTWAQFAAHIAYLNSFVHLRWVNVVFWSLGIEFQYYVWIGLAFPLLVTRRRILRYGAFLCMLAASLLVRDDALIFRYLPLFAAGILAFQSRAGLISKWELAAGLAATLIAGPIAWVGIATALIVRYLELPSTKLGVISYSLYLLHVPISGKIMNLGGRIATGTPALCGVLLAAVAASIAAAAVFYKWVELPSQRISSAIRLGTRDSASTPAVRRRSSPVPTQSHTGLRGPSTARTRKAAHWA